MKWINLFLLLFCYVLAVAQGEQTDPVLQNIKRELTLAKNSYEAKRYPLCISFAQVAYQKAESIGRKEEKAIALHWEGKAMLQMKKGFFYKNKAGKKLWESTRILRQNGKNKKLLKDNLVLLREFAKERGKLEELDRIKHLEDLFKNDTLLAGSKKIKESNQFNQLNEQLESLSQENEELEKAAEGFQKELEKMTAIQMKRELTLAKQKMSLDSMAMVNMKDSMELAHQMMELQERESKLMVDQERLNFFRALGGIGVALAIGGFLLYFNTKRLNKKLAQKNNVIQDEQRRSEELLLNILPATIAAELKATGMTKTRQYHQATVLFADFKDFTGISKKLPPEKLVADLDHCFCAFDRIVEKYQLEKIKTIGDAYMCAGGLPNPSNTHPINVVMAALEMQRFLREWKLEKIDKNEPCFEARIGIHSGPLIAGVVGEKKFVYDIWGSTVNVASRMESNGEVGKINISETTYDLVKNNFNCVYRGKIPAKNIGEVDMYFVEEINSN